MGERDDRTRTPSEMIETYQRERLFSDAEMQHVKQVASVVQDSMPAMTDPDGGEFDDAAAERMIQDISDISKLGDLDRDRRGIVMAEGVKLGFVRQIEAPVQEFAESLRFMLSL